MTPGVPSSAAGAREHSLILREIAATQRDSWNRAVSSLPTGHVLQSFEWGDLKERLGWQCYRLLAEQDSIPRGAALVLRRTLPIPGLSIMYVPKGPCFDPDDVAAFSALLDALKGIARREGAIFIRLDPDLTAEHGPALEVLSRHGFHRSSEEVQLRNTMLVDLRPTEKEMLSRMSQSTRRNISIAQRKGVEIIEGKPEDIDIFYDLYRETAERDGFILRTKDYYEHLWRVFLEQGMAQAYFATWQGDPLAGCLILHSGKKAWYILGASRTEKREVRPNQLMQWEAMRRAKVLGAESYDMWGLPDVLEPGKPMWGLYQFKKGFGAELRQWVGAYDYVPRPVWRSLWAHAFPLYIRMRGGSVSSLGGEGAAAGEED